MPTARHGIFPTEHAGVIYLAGGGTSSGFGQSNLLEAYYVDAISNGTESVTQLQPLDTNGDGNVTALDALVVINSLGASESESPENRTSTLPSLYRLDANRDGKVTALDALTIINQLARRTPMMESEFAAANDAMGPLSFDIAISSFDDDDDDLLLLMAEDHGSLKPGSN